MLKPFECLRLLCHKRGTLLRCALFEGCLDCLCCRLQRSHSDIHRFFNKCFEVMSHFLDDGKPMVVRVGAAHVACFVEKGEDDGLLANTG